MKTLFTLATALFWALLVLLVSPGPQQAAPAVAAPPAARAVPLAEVARHNRRDSCWMAIDGQVHDFTAYLPSHPADPAVMLRHCGTEASRAFATKDAGRPHSPRAVKMLENYRIGELAP
jgi:cytochrome b involved in lipid metabolism